MYLWCLYFVCSALLWSSTSANQYYVSANEGTDCPTNGLPCNDFEYYYLQFPEYFASDTVFYFLEGRHVLDHRGLLEIGNVSNLTLKGVEERVRGFDDTVVQSSSVIECSDGAESGIAVVSSSQVTLEHITVTNCGSKTLDGSSVSVYLNNVHDVVLNSISVQNGSGAGIVLVNCLNLLLIESSFAQNDAIPNEIDLLNGGNVFITYNQWVSDYDEGGEYSLTVLRTNSSFARSDAITGHGGGIQIVLSGVETYTVNILIDSVVLRGNFGRQGGNLDLYVQSTCCYTFLLNNSLLVGGLGEFGAGMIIDHVSNSVTGNTSIVLQNTEFINNRAISGGGLSVYWFRNSHSATVVIRDCIIRGNSGESGSGFLAYSTKDLLRCSSLIIVMSNVTIESNQIDNSITDSPKGGVVLIDVHILMEFITIQNHLSSGLLVIASIITFQNDSYFINNTGVNGGGIAMYDSSILVISPPAKLSFIDNHATEYGGAIYILQEININYLLVTDDCFYRNTEGSNIETGENGTIEMWYYFDSNTAAITGDILYGGNVSQCSHFKLEFGSFNNTVESSPISSDAIQVCFCDEDGLPNCSKMKKSVSLTPGEEHFTLLAVVGQEGGLTRGTIQFTQYPMGGRLSVADLNATCSNVSFTVSSQVTETVIPIYTSLISSNDPNSDTLAKIINVTVQQCPFGFDIVDSSMCQCKSELSKLGFSCDIGSETISCDVNTCAKVWIKYVNDTDCQELLVSKNCPFDYCNSNSITFSVTETPDIQCAHNRSGLLCGECSEGFSLVLGSNSCKECSNAYISLVIPFALAGIGLVAFIIALNMTVTSGTINGLIFYANIIKLYEHAIFTDGQLPFLSEFISWVNMDLGIETCFFHGMDACSKMWLQFVFPVYIWLLVLAIILVARRFPMSLMVVTSNAVPVLATLVLLSYTKLIRAVISALYIARVDCKGVVWRVDPDATDSACYIILVVISTLIFVSLILPYTLFLLLLPLIGGPLSNYMLFRKFSNKLKPFIDAYGGPYKDRYRFWTGLLLSIRVILALVVPFDEGAVISIDLLLFILIGLVTVYVVSGGVYNNVRKSYVEVFFILNLTIIAYVTSEQNKEEFETKRLAYIIILMVSAFLVFCGIVAYHCYKRTRDSEYVQAKLPPVLIKFRLKKVEEEPEVPESDARRFSHHNTALDMEDTLHTSKSYASTTMPSPGSSPLPVRRESILFQDDNPKPKHK